MVYGPIQWWYSWTGNPQDMRRDFLDTPIVSVEDSRVQIDTIVQPPTLFLLLLQMKISISGMLVRRQIIEKVGGFEETFRGLYEDQVFCAKVCLQFPVFVASKFWYKYRQHPNSCCNTAANRKVKEYTARLTFLNWVYQYLSVHDVKDSRVWRVFMEEKLRVVHPILYFGSLNLKIRISIAGIEKIFFKKLLRWVND